MNYRQKQRTFQRGFTLIELIVVLAIIGVMAVGVFTVLNPSAQIQKTRDSQRKSDLRQVQTALELYNQDVGRYPPNGTIIFGGSWGTYMSSVPNDPTGKSYIYVVDDAGTAGSGYRLFASLDRGANDSQACSASNPCPNTTMPANCGTGYTCNYVVTSSNLSR